MDLHDQWTTLLKRPDLEQAKKQYVQMQTEISTKLSKEFDLPKWNKGGDGSGSGCGKEFAAVDELDKDDWYMPKWSSPKGISAKDWPRAKKLIQQIAGKYGFDHVASDISKSGMLMFELTAPSGADLLASANGDEATSMTVNTGCHLTPEAHKRGRPMNAEEKKAAEKKTDDELLRKAGVKTKHK